MSSRIANLLLGASLVVVVPRAGAVDRHWTGGAGTFIFNNVANWSPVGVPFSDDLAWIDQPVTVTATLTNHTEDLTLSDGGWLIVDSSSGGFRVDDLTILAKNDANAVQLFVENTPAVVDFDTNRLHILGGAELDMEGGFCDVNVNLFMDTQSRITGRGVVDFGGGGEEFTNDGTIRPDGGLLTLRSPTPGIVGPFDLDGNLEGGTLDVTSGTASLLIDAALTDGFSGDMTIGDGNYVQFTKDWSATGASSIALTGGAAGPAVLRGAGTANLFGSVVVSGNAEIESDAILQSDANISIGPGAELRMEGQTTYVHPFLSGSGTLVQVGPARVVHDTQMFVAANFSSSGPVTLVGADLQFSAPTVFDSAQVSSADADSRLDVYGHLIVNGVSQVDAKSVLAAISEVTLNSGAELRLLRDTQIWGADIHGSGKLVLHITSVMAESTIASQVRFEAGAVSLSTSLQLAGYSEFAGGTMGGFGPLVMDGVGMVTANTFIGSASVDLDGWGGTGAWTIAPARTLTITSLIVDPDNDQFNGTMTVQEGATLKFTSGVDWQVGTIGTVNMDAPTSRISGRNVSLVVPSASLTGKGRIDQLLSNGGRVSPGRPTGLLQVGEYVQSAAGILSIEIGGPSPGEFDVLLAQGSASLDGTLEISTIGGFVPSPGNVFPFLVGAAVTDEFSIVTGTTFGLGAGQFYHLVEFPDHLSLYVPLIGDANFDGQVSGADYTLWADNFGSGYAWGQGDFNGDGLVTGADYTQWADHFGESVTLATTAAPEPGALQAAAVCGLAVLAMRIRRAPAR